MIIIKRCKKLELTMQISLTITNNIKLKVRTLLQHVGFFEFFFIIQHSDI